MRVLILETYASATYGGAEKSMSAFSEYLENAGHEVFVVCEKLMDYAVEKERVLILDTQPPGVQGHWSYLRSLLKVRNFVKKHRIELLLTHTIHAFPFIRLLKNMTEIRTILYFKWVYNEEDLGYLNSWGIKGMDHYVAINTVVGKYWETHLTPDQKITYIPDGISFEHSKQHCTKQKSENISKLLYFGRIIEGKGLHLLLEALALLPQTFTLRVLGDFDPGLANQKISYYQYEIQELVLSLGLQNKVHFEGHVKNVQPFISESDLVVVPSIVEDAQPFSILESFALNRPAIGTNRGGIPKIFQGDSFWYCEPHPEAIFKKIQEFADMDPQQLSARTKKMGNSIEERYNITNTQSQLLENCWLLVN